MNGTVAVTRIRAGPVRLYIREGPVKRARPGGIDAPDSTRKAGSHSLAMDPLEAARVLARARGDTVVVPHMSAERYWPAVTDRPELDIASPDTMGQAAAFTLGLALARPERRFMVLDGDGALLMSLGTLVTVADAAPANFVHVVFADGAYGSAAGVPVPGGARTDFRLLAQGAGYAGAYEFDDLEELASDLRGILEQRGPTMIVLRVDPMDPDRDLPAPVDRTGFHERARAYRRRLAGPPGPV